jgi:hypothetical protein
MNGGSFKRAIRVPFTSPMKPPVRIPMTMPTGSGRPIFVTATPVMTAESDMTVPIDRSMPPEMMTNVSPMAKTPVTDVATRMPFMFSKLKKYGDAKLKKMINTMRAPKAIKRWIASPRIAIARGPRGVRKRPL